MEIEIERLYRKATYTIGKLYIDGIYFCDTLEDRVRELPAECPDTSAGRPCRCAGKVYSSTAIPSGRYKVTMEYSPKFGRILPYLHNVPHFTGILIHSGNTEADSAGCILVGRNTVPGRVRDSRDTLRRLTELLMKEKNITISIR